VTNAGTIDGGSLSAITTPGSAYYSSITNSGTITSANATATISVVRNGSVGLVNSGTVANTGGGAALVAPSSVVNQTGGAISANGDTVITGANLSVTNSGTITNTGNGTALSGSNLTLVNDPGGVISGGSGSPAIAVAGTLSLVNQGTINGDVYAGGIGTVDSSLGAINGNVTFGTSGDTVVATLVNGAVQTGITGTITAPAGINTLQIDTSTDATLSRAVTLSANFNQLALSPASGTTLTLASGFSSSGTIDFIGYGTLANTTDLSGSGTVIEAEFSAGNFVNTSAVVSTNASDPAAIILTGYSTLTNSGTITAAGTGVSLSYYGTLVNMAGGMISGIRAISNQNGAAIVVNAGQIEGNVNLAAGSVYDAVTGGSLNGNLTLGTGGTLIVNYSATSAFAGINGNAVLGGVTITEGDLVGLVGSTITTATLSIGAQGTFQSGGTVNGNIVNVGTLHVGASPDTLKVNGNVALNAGSTTLFEVSPSASSKLVVSGKVTIASGATLQIKTLQAIMPGTSLDLIAAAGGITGTFSQVDGLYGKLMMVDGDLTMLALFDPAYAPNAQVAGSIGYVNSALASGNASSALMAALPALTASDGAPMAGAFARLTPEAYASAIQIGVENGMILSRAARDISADHTMVSGHLFSFGQALGNWRGMHGDSEGASAANISGFGFLGGLGIQAGPVSLAAFGGYLDQTQSIATLGASTRATGFVGGVTAGLETGPASATVSVLRDQSNATTTRSLPSSGHASADYALHGWTVDAQIGVRLPLGSGWQAKPHVGWTWVWTERGAVNEVGNSVFALDVDAMHHTAGFADGGLRIASDPAAQRRLTSFVDLGVRWQMQGRLPTAQGSFDSLPTDFVAQGVRRSPFSALVSSGVSYRLTPAINVLFSASGELTETGASANVTSGVRVNF